MKIFNSLTRDLFTAFAAVAMVLLVNMPGAYAQEISESHLEAARETVAVSKATDQMDSILPDLSDQIKEQLISNRPDQADRLSAIVDEVAVSLAPRRGDLESEVARIYAQIFSEEELRAITEFYRSPAGQKLIEQTPVIFRAMEQASRVWTSGVRRDFQEQVAKRMEEEGLN